MRIVVVGAGTIGKAVVDVLRSRHEIDPVARTQGEHRVDLTLRDSTQKLSLAAKGRIQEAGFRRQGAPPPKSRRSKGAATASLSMRESSA